MKLTLWQLVLALAIIAPTATAQVCAPGANLNSIGIKESRNGRTYQRSLKKKFGGGPRVAVVAYDGTGVAGDTLAGFGDEDAQVKLFATREVVVVPDDRGYYGVGAKQRDGMETKIYAAARAKTRAAKKAAKLAAKEERKREFNDRKQARAEKKALMQEARRQRKADSKEDKIRKREERLMKKCAKENKRKKFDKLGCNKYGEYNAAAVKSRKSSKSNKSNKSSGSNKSNKKDKSSGSNKSNKSNGSNKSNKKNKSNGSNKSNKKNKSGGNNKSAKSAKSSGNNKSAKSANSSGSNKSAKAKSAGDKELREKCGKIKNRNNRKYKKLGCAKFERRLRSGRQLQEAVDDNVEINGSDVLRFDFGCLEFKRIVVGAANLLPNESAQYRLYKSGQKVEEGSFTGTANGAIEHTIASQTGFDVVEFLAPSESAYLLSYIHYCKTGTCSGNIASFSGDPHMTSFDGQRWDCQGHGHFLAFQGIKGNGDEDFQLQAIFDKKPGRTAQVTVTRAVLIDSGIPDAPVLQLSVPRTTDQGCDYAFYVDGAPADLSTWEDPQGKVELKTACGSGSSTAKRLTFSYPETDTEVTVSVKASRSNGCVIASSICLGSYWDAPENDVRGLLGGKKNGNKLDDWIDRDGVPVEFNELLKKGSAAYDFCTDNWCLTEGEADKFTYAPGENFATYDFCTDVYDGAAEELVEQVEEGPIFAAGKAKESKDACIAGANNDDDAQDCFLEIAYTNANGGDPAEAAEQFEEEKEEEEKMTEPEGEDDELPKELEAVIYSAGGAKERQYESGARGDPHIKDWTGALYDFHGVCDLVLLQNPGFQNGLGMDINMRTKKSRQWSYISTAVLRIGEDTFEVMGEKKQNRYWINGILGEELSHDMILPTTISGFPIQYKHVNSQQKEYTIDLGQGESIVFKTWHNMVRVDVVGATAENFASSVGLMGTFQGGLKVARDKSTILENANDFGQEWQVLPSEPVLFHNIEGPQAPMKCEIPSQMQERRNLAESTISLEASQKACAGIEDEDEYDLCVFDVMATNDIGVAGAY